MYAPLVAVNSKYTCLRLCASLQSSPSTVSACLCHLAGLPRAPSCIKVHVSLMQFFSQFFVIISPMLLYCATSVWLRQNDTPETRHAHQNEHVFE